MITLEDWALIRRLHLSEGLPKAVIAVQLGLSRNTVAKAVASADPPSYSAGSDGFRCCRGSGSGLAGGDALNARDGVG